MIAHTIAYNGPHRSFSARLPNESPTHLPMYVITSVGSMMCAVVVALFYALVILNYGVCAFIENEGCSEVAHGLTNAFSAVFTFPKRSQFYDQLGYAIAYFILFVIFTVGNYQLWSPQKQEKNVLRKGLRRARIAESLSFFAEISRYVCTPSISKSFSVYSIIP